MKEKLYLKLIDIKMDTSVYDMYQDIPKEELGSSNFFYGLSYEEYENKLLEVKNNEKVIDGKINTTTNRYIMFADNKPVGELGIRTTLNDFWINKGSQIFYKIRKSERNKGYGNKILQLGLNECKKLGMNKVRINCSDANEASKKVILNNGGILDIANYKTNEGTSSSYIIELDKHIINDSIAIQMFNIVEYNMKDIVNINEDNLYETWYNNCINNNEVKTIISFDNDEVIGYIQYINNEDHIILSEFQIKKEYQGDRKTFKELLLKFIGDSNLKENDLIKCHINDSNVKSKQVFTALGFINIEKNIYEIYGKKLLKWKEEIL